MRLGVVMAYAHGEPKKLWKAVKKVTPEPSRGAASQDEDYVQSKWWEDENPDEASLE